MGVGCSGEAHRRVSSFLDLLSEGSKALEEGKVPGKVAGSRTVERELPHSLEQYCLWVDVSLKERLTNAHLIDSCRLRMCCEMGFPYIFRDKLVVTLQC